METEKQPAPNGGLPRNAARTRANDALEKELVALLATADVESLEADSVGAEDWGEAIAMQVTALHAALGDECREASPPKPIKGVTWKGRLIRQCLHTASQKNGPHRWDRNGDPIP